MVYSTVSIQNVADICVALAFGVAFPVGSPSRKAMLSVPPPNSGAAGMGLMLIARNGVTFWWAMWLARIRLGLSRMSWVIVPAATKEVRSCGIRSVFSSVTFWLGKRNAGPFTKLGVISATSNAGFPAMGAVKVP